MRRAIVGATLVMLVMLLMWVTLGRQRAEVPKRIVPASLPVSGEGGVAVDQETGAASAGMIEGAVLDGEGPVEHALIEAWGQELSPGGVLSGDPLSIERAAAALATNATVAARAESDGEGRFSMGGLPAGSYFVLCNGHDSGFG
ncbi:MAG: hypothetical protein JXA57_14195, partial [Armatimonadetes bacterium]|nr:hypothetical protein [Armatimonadota bacterium]